MDGTLERYVGFRIGDLLPCSGFLFTYPICIYGDSHAIIMFNKLKPLNKNMYDMGKTMYSVGRDGTIPNYDPANINSGTTVCLALGEIDVRCHIGKQVLLGRDATVICKELVAAYFKTVGKLFRISKKIIIVGVSPPTDPKDHAPHQSSHKVALPFVGTNSERVFYTELLNSVLESACLRYGYTFFSPYSFYTRQDGCLKYELSDGCIHIGKSEYLLEEFEKLL